MGFNACQYQAHVARCQPQFRKFFTIGRQEIMRISVFIDFWNLRLTLGQFLPKNPGAASPRVEIDWKVIGKALANEANKVLDRGSEAFSYEGAYIYTSYNPATDKDRKFKAWASSWLDKQPGNNVRILERRPKSLPRCPACHRVITHCPHHGCEKPIVATVEKGVDTMLVTDLIRLGVSDLYDVAVLASSDADMIPAVRYVQDRGKKVINAGFKKVGYELANKCWGSFHISDPDIQSRILR